MPYHRQLKIKENGKPILKPTNEEIIERKIKNLQKYQRKLIKCSYEELPKLLEKLLIYIIKKEIVKNPEYIKEQANSFITSIINSYKNDYNPQERTIIINNILSLYAEAKQGTENTLIEYNTLKEMKVLSKNPLKIYTNWDYKFK